MKDQAFEECLFVHL